jgi:hypothetical protein
MQLTINSRSLLFALLLALLGVAAKAEKPGQKCPVTIQIVELSYSHSGGQSTPQLGAVFANHAGKPIATITFSLSQLDSGGYPHPYPDDLIFSGGLGPGKLKHFSWELAPEAVDLRRTGELLVLHEVHFDDATGWKDDGSESCSFTVDYHAK